MKRKTFLRTMGGAFAALALPVAVLTEDEWLDEAPNGLAEYVDVKNVPYLIRRGDGVFCEWPEVEVLRVTQDDMLAALFPAD